MVSTKILLGGRSDILFFSTRKWEGGVRGAGGGGGRFFIQKCQEGGLQEGGGGGRGGGAGRVSAVNWGTGGGGAKYFFPGPKFAAAKVLSENN